MKPPEHVIAATPMSPSLKPKPTEIASIQFNHQLQQTFVISILNIRSIPLILPNLFIICYLYDTIQRDAILTCARKPTWVGLIYHTETITKNCKTEKLKIKSRYVRSNSKSLGNNVVSSEKEKERLQGKGFEEKKVLSLEWKRQWVMKN